MAAKNGTLAVWEKLKPLIDAEIAQQTRSCCRMVQMVVATPYNAETNTVGVQEAFGGIINIPVSGSVDTSKLERGTSVWAVVPFSSYSNAIVLMLGDGETGFADDAAKFGGKDPQYYLSPKNLLGNGWLANPVNQKRETSYTGAGYTIDRWRQSNSYATTAVGDGFVRFSASGGIAYPRQIMIFSAEMYDKTYTAALCTADGKIVTASSFVSSTPVETETTLASGYVSNGVYLRLTQSPNDRVSFRIDISDGNSIDLIWAAVYEGSYNAANIPPFAEPDYYDELANCRWYFRRIWAETTYATIGVGVAISSTQAWINIPRQSMRITNPTVTLNGLPRLTYGTGAVDCTAATVDKISDCFIRLVVTASGLTAGNAVVATSGANAGFYIDENANI